MTNASGGIHSQMRYYAYGEVRWSSGTVPTDRRFTGQREETGLGLYDYVARRYDPYLSRFIQPDTIMPDPSNPQSLNRYTYAYGNPLLYIGPDGHDPIIVSVGLFALAGAVGGGPSLRRLPELERRANRPDWTCSRCRCGCCFRRGIGLRHFGRCHSRHRRWFQYSPTGACASNQGRTHRSELRLPIYQSCIGAAMWVAGYLWQGSN